MSRDLPFSNHPSTKIEILGTIIGWHIGHIARNPLINNPALDNEDDDPPEGEIGHSLQPALTNLLNSDWTVPALPDHTPPDKIIVYLAFPSLNWLIGSVRTVQISAICPC